MRQINHLEPSFDSIETEKAPAHELPKHILMQKRVFAPDDPGV
jgi:hypothetical protein